MRTSFDIPDGLYRTLKVRAGVTGISMRELVLQLLERGLKVAQPEAKTPGRADDPPIIIPSDGIPIRALSRDQMASIEDEEDRQKYA